MKKLKVVCGSNNKAERNYIIKIILTDFLGINVELDFRHNKTTYDIIFNNKIISFKDSFFALNFVSLDYLKIDNIPQTIGYLDSEYVENLPIIYGCNEFTKETNKIYCGLDIFASSFFMLTRWEEFVIQKERRILKVNECDLLAIKEGFYNRPIVNEYTVFLAKLLSISGYTIEPPKRQFKIKLTHDVDWVYLSTQKELFRNLVKRIFRNGQTKKSLKILFNFYYYRLKKVNPFNSFEEIMDYADSKGLRTAFFFKAMKIGESGYTYDINYTEIQDKVHSILKRGHEVGFHPSENTVFENEKFREEAQRLEIMVDGPVLGGRNHGLFYNYNTFKQWESNGFKYDSGMGYQYVNGFRCGTCNEFLLFDVYERRVLDLKEIPFIAMDTIVLRRKISPQKMRDNVKQLLDIVRKYNGSVSLNWHSNLINSREMRLYKYIYFEIIDYVAAINAQC